MWNIISIFRTARMSAGGPLSFLRRGEDGQAQQQPKNDERSSFHVDSPRGLLENNYIPRDAWWHHRGKNSDRLAICASVSRYS